jgi:hypothetical protein
MARRILGPIIGAIAVGAMLALPGSAAGDGAPAPFTTYGVSGPTGLEYMAVPRGHGATLVRKLDHKETLASKNLNRPFAVPGVTVHALPDGLSADGGTLVLVNPRQRVTDGPTHVIVLDTDSLRIMRRLTLSSGFTFDAISPDGSAIYFIQYLSPQDPTKYAVREYDVRQGKLLREPIVDPNEHAGEMRGYALDRVTGSDGRWAYTLYDGGGGEPFVHALDTVKGRAVCVDLDDLVAASQVRDVRMAMSPSDDQLTLTMKKEPLAVVDTQTLKASAPVALDEAANTGSQADGIPWVLIAIGAALGLGTGGIVITTRRRRMSRIAAHDG